MVRCCAAAYAHAVTNAIIHRTRKETADPIPRLTALGGFEVDNRADHLACLHRLEPLVDLLQADALRDPVIQVQAALQVQAR